jgi:hypothetical protein
VKPGIELLSEVNGEGAPVLKHQTYRFSLRMWLSRGEPVVWSQPWGENLNVAKLQEEGTLLETELRVDREMMFAGLFHGVQGMRLGGERRLRIAPHLAYGEAGVAGSIPPNALLLVEVKALESRVLVVNKNAV